MGASFFVEVETTAGQKHLVALDHVAYAAEGGPSDFMIGLDGAGEMRVKGSLKEFARVLESAGASWDGPRQTPPPVAAPTPVARPLPRLVDGLPRRMRQDHLTPAETAVLAAGHAIEAAGADERLTTAGDLLQRARALVADYFEDVPMRPAERP